MPPTPDPTTDARTLAEAPPAALAVLDVLPTFGEQGITAGEVGAAVAVTEDRAARLLGQLTRLRLVAATRRTRTSPARFTLDESNHQKEQT